MSNRYIVIRASTEDYISKASIMGILAVLGIVGAAVAAEPATKDLVPCADRALHGFMVRSVDPVPDHPELRQAAFGCAALPTPSIVHSQWDWGDCTARAIRDWVYLREMTGEQTFGRDVEDSQQATLLWLLVPETGMPCVPERSGIPATTRQAHSGRAASAREDQVLREVHRHPRSEPGRLGCAVGPC